MAPTIRVLLMCNWTDSESLLLLWEKMSMGRCRWNNLEMVSSLPADYCVVVNSPPPSDGEFTFDRKRTIVFRMEPRMETRPDLWGEWSNPDPSQFLFAGLHSKHHNNYEWHLSKTRERLSVEIPEKTMGLSMSTVLSDKYSDPGHVKRIDFAKFLERKNRVDLHVYGGNKFLWRDYRGPLPSHQKDDALFPYKYTFNVENHSIPGYATEKLIDGILAESLVFYHGCPNIREYIDPEAYFWLDLSNFELDASRIATAISDGEWERRLPAIRREKARILNETQFFPRVEGILRDAGVDVFGEDNTGI